MAALKLSEILDSGNLSLGFAEALAKILLGRALEGPIIESATVDATTGQIVLANRALVIEAVWNDTDSGPMTPIPDGETPAANSTVAVGADRKTLTFHATDKSDVMKIVYIPIGDATAAYPG